MDSSQSREEHRAKKSHRSKKKIDRGKLLLLVRILLIVILVVAIAGLYYLNIRRTRQVDNSRFDQSITRLMAAVNKNVTDNFQPFFTDPAVAAEFIAFHKGIGPALDGRSLFTSPISATKDGKTVQVSYRSKFGDGTSAVEKFTLLEVGKDSIRVSNYSIDYQTLPILFGNVLSPYVGESDYLKEYSAVLAAFDHADESFFARHLPFPVRIESDAFSRFEQWENAYGKISDRKLDKVLYRRGMTKLEDAEFLVVSSIVKMMKRDYEYETAETVFLFRHPVMTGGKWSAYAYDPGMPLVSQRPTELKK